MAKRFDLHNQRFAGERMTQAWSDLCLWEAFFNERRLGTLIELGTGAGGMALFLGLQCHQRGIQFYTFDHQQHFDFSRGLAQLINLHASFRHVDIFSEAGIEYISGVMEDCPRPLAVFFDNGNKRREWSLFAARLRAGESGMSSTPIVTGASWVCVKIQVQRIAPGAAMRACQPSFSGHGPWMRPSAAKACR